MTSKQRRLLILGAGGWGGNWVRVANEHPDWDVAGYVDANPAVLSRLASERGVPPSCLFSDWHQGLDRMAPDAVTLSVPNPHRLPMLEECLRRGLHILADKPLVHTPEQARRLREMADASTGVFMVAQNYRLFPEVVAVKSLLEDGLLGPVADVRLTFLRSFRRTFSPSYFIASLPGWTALGLEMGIHHWDLMRYFIGADPVVVRAWGTRHPWSWGAGFTVLEAHLEFPNGVPVTYTATNDYPADVTDWPGHWEIRSRNGVVAWGRPGIPLAACDADGTPVKVEVVPQDSLTAVFQRFTDAVDDPKAAHFCPLADNLKSLAVSWAAERSAQSGRDVEYAAFLQEEGLA